MLVLLKYREPEEMWDAEVGQPRTAHTTNPVPFLYITPEGTPLELPMKELADIAPFLLTNLGLEVPPEMAHIKE
jgi:2,3-bisphosphoglycerate-independent phosphoglycerate mutase